MELNQFVRPLGAADAFHKNVFLMFDDLVASIREQNLATTITDRHQPELMYHLWRVRSGFASQHKHLYIFELQGRIRFVQVLVKVSEEKLDGQGAQYKAVCTKLALDPVIPLLVVFGVLRPRDVQRFIVEIPLRRDWADNTVLLGLPDDIHLADPNLYEWNKSIALESTVGTDSRYCESATVKLWPLAEIRNQGDIAMIVRELLTEV